jgi:hypothetical protein
VTTPKARCAEALPSISKESLAVKRRIVATMIVAALTALVAFLGSGCLGNDHHVQIESNSCWVIVFDRSSDAIDAQCGRGNYRVAGTIHCVRVTNQADTGFVRVRIDGGPWSENDNPRGTAIACR